MIKDEIWISLGVKNPLPKPEVAWINKLSWLLSCPRALPPRSSWGKRFKKIFVPNRCNAHTEL